MQHSTLYQQLINSRKWRQLRAEKLAANPLCERHLKEGKVVAASVVHHIVEVESGHNEAECSHTRKAHQDREQQRLEQWKDRLTKTIPQHPPEKA